DSGIPSDATLFLGYILINGDKAEVEEGIQLLNEHDSPYAHHSLALHYLPDRNGHGGDLEKAVHHLKLAADKGNEDAWPEMQSNVKNWSPAFRKALQRYLKAEGYYSGTIDG